MKERIIIGLVWVLVIFTACSLRPDPDSEPTKTEIKQGIDETVTKSKEVLSEGLEKTKEQFSKVKEKFNKVKESLTSSKKDNEVAVEFSGSFHEILGMSKFDIEVEDGYHTGGLDKYGRPTWASIRLTKEIYEKEKKEDREEIKVDPKGWPKKNPKVILEYADGSHYKGYLWNRSHMIADSLGGEATIENLITGTRPQNVGTRSNNGGMAYTENKIREYFDSGNSGTVDYLVENYYEYDTDVIPKYTIVNVKSSDHTIDEKVVVFNIAPGYVIDYENTNNTRKE